MPNVSDFGDKLSSELSVSELGSLQHSVSRLIEFKDFDVSLGCPPLCVIRAFSTHCTLNSYEQEEFSARNDIIEHFPKFQETITLPVSDSHSISQTGAETLLLSIRMQQILRIVMIDLSSVIQPLENYS